MDRWSRFLPNGEQVECAPGDLSPFERFKIGGPWLDPGSCALHLQRVLESGHWPLVAVEDRGTVVGELEAIVGPDLRWGLTVHLDVLAVHRDAQRKGVGRALIDEARRRAERAGAVTLTTNPEETAVGFYERCGLTSVLARQADVSLPVQVDEESVEAVAPGAPVREFRALEGLDLTLGRFQTSFATWIKSRWTLPGLTGTLRREEGSIPSRGAVYRLWQSPRLPSTASAYAWTSPTADLAAVLRSVAGRAAELGYETLETTVDVRQLEMCRGLPLVVGRESVLLGSGLMSPRRRASVAEG